MDEEFIAYENKRKKHPFYDFKYKEFKNKWQKKCGAIDNGKLLELMWADHWKNELAKIKKYEYNKRLLNLKEEYNIQQTFNVSLNEEDVPCKDFEFINTLDILKGFCDENIFGKLNPVFNNLIVMAKNALPLNEKIIKILSDPDNILLIEMIIDKLEYHKNNSIKEIRFKYTFGLRETKRFLDYINKSVKTQKLQCIPLDLKAIKKASKLIKDKKSFYEFIKNALLYEGYDNPSEEYIQNIISNLNVNE